MKLLTSVLLLFILFSCSDEIEGNVAEEDVFEEMLDLNATVLFKIDTTIKEEFFITIKSKDTFMTNRISPYDFKNLKGGIYDLTVSTFFNDVYDTTITIKDSFFVFDIKHFMVKNYINDTSADNFFKNNSNLKQFKFYYDFYGGTAYNGQDSYFSAILKNDLTYLTAYSFENDSIKTYKFILEYNLFEKIKEFQNITPKPIRKVSSNGNYTVLIVCVTPPVGGRYIVLNNGFSKIKISLKNEKLKGLMSNLSIVSLKQNKLRKQLLPLSPIENKNKALILTDYLDQYDDNLILFGGIDVEESSIKNIDKISKEKFSFPIESGDNCEQFNFVHINSKEVKGWFSGEHLYEFNKTGRDSSFTLQSIDFKINVTQNFGVGSYDEIEEETTFCGSENPVVLYNSKYNREDLVYIDENSFGYPSEYLTLDASDMWGDEITGINYQNDSLTLNIRREHQEGHEEFVFLIFLNKNYTKGKIISNTYYP